MRSPCLWSFAAALLLRSLFSVVYAAAEHDAASATSSSPAVVSEMALPLMPWPESVHRHAGRLMLNNALTIQIDGDTLPQMVDEWRERIAAQTGWILRPQPARVRTPTIHIVIRQAVPPVPTPDMDERYTLTITTQGVHLNAETRFGALRGMETVLQLLTNGADGTSLPLVTIRDAPRWRWRGLMLDSARHFLPVEDIKRQIRGMAAAKLNVLHWHLTDDQGWRFASQHFPALQNQASDGLFYRVSDMQAIVAYAARYGIRVVPEIDFPGHSSAVAVAYPQYVSEPKKAPMQREWGGHRAVLDPTRAETYHFIDTLIGELAAIFPDPYIHIGGDEVDDTQWRASASIQHYMQQQGLADSQALQAYFNRRLEALLRHHQRRMIGWDEIFHPDLPKTVLIQSWRGLDALQSIARQGYQGILSAGFYLDQPQSTAYHYRNQLLSPAVAPLDKAEPGVRQQSWQFTLPRLKGSAVTGAFTLMHGAQGWSGYIDFSGQPRRRISAIRWLSPTRFTFTVDSWMGETRPVVTLEGDHIEGYFVIGNVRYPFQGEALSAPPEGEWPAALTLAQQQNILGGEAALWSENVTAALLDLKLWPRLFAVAERLWSSPQVDDVDAMYRRLAQVDVWSVVSVGLQHYAERQRAMMRLLNSTQIMPLQQFSEMLEPAQYYTRHHLKYRAGDYNQFTALNRLADSLPPESLAVRQLAQQVDRLLADHADTHAAQAIVDQLTRWKQTLPDIRQAVAQNRQLAGLAPLPDEAETVIDYGLKLVRRIQNDTAPGAQEREHMQQQLDAAAEVCDETVLAIVYPIEKLLQALR